MVGPFLLLTPHLFVFVCVFGVNHSQWSLLDDVNWWIFTGVGNM